MTEATTRDSAKDTIAISAATMGHDLVAALLSELRGMPDHWSKLNSDLQQKIIERLKDKTREAIDKAVVLLMRADFQAVPAKLEFVSRKDGIKAGLTVNADAVCRHALFDAAGAQVLIVIADPKRWTERMDEIKAKDDQLELFDPAANYDPSVDQPGYRRDQDPYVPAGKTWADLKASFGVAPPEGKPDDTKGPTVFDAALAEWQKQYDAAFLELFGKPHGDLTTEELASPEAVEAHNKVLERIGLAPFTDLTEDQQRRAAENALQEQLAEAGVVVSLGALQAATEAQVNEARAWVETYLVDPNACTIERPAWLPAPNDAAPQ